MAKQNKLKQHLSKFKEAIPNRAKLAYETMFAPTEAQRSAAQCLLDLLPQETRTADEKIRWQTDVWLNAPKSAELMLSPAGRKILEMVADSKPLPKEVWKAEPESNAPYPEPSKPAEPSIPPLQPPPGPSDDLGIRMQQERDAKAESERLAGPVHKWVQAMPSKPDKSMRPLAPSDWNSDASNDPIY